MSKKERKDTEPMFINNRKILLYVSSVLLATMVAYALNCPSGSGTSSQTCQHSACGAAFCASGAGLCASCDESTWVWDKKVKLTASWVWHPAPDPGTGTPPPYCCGGETFYRYYVDYYDSTCFKCGDLRKSVSGSLFQEGDSWPCPSYVE